MVIYKNERKEHNTIHRRHNPEYLTNWLKAGSNATRGKSKTEEHKQKLSESLKEYFKTHDNPMKNRPLSEETKQKLRDWHKDHEIIFSDDARRKCSEAGKKTAKIKKCYINENGNEVWMRPSNKAQHHPNWKLKEE